jgi:hypothetical protein
MIFNKLQKRGINFLKILLSLPSKKHFPSAACPVEYSGQFFFIEKIPGLYVL